MIQKSLVEPLISERYSDKRSNSSTLLCRHPEQCKGKTRKLRKCWDFNWL